MSGSEAVQDRFLAHRLDLDPWPPARLAEARRHDVLEVASGVGFRKNEKLVLQKLPVEEIATRQAMVLVQNRYNARRPQPQMVASIAVNSPRRDHEIQCTALKFVKKRFPIGFLCREPDRGVGGNEAVEGMLQRALRDRRHEPDVEAGGEAGRRLTGACEQRVCIEDEAPRSLKKRFPCRSRPHTRGIAGEQVDAERDLQIANVPPEG